MCISDSFPTCKSINFAYFCAFHYAFPTFPQTSHFVYTFELFPSHISRPIAYISQGFRLQHQQHRISCVFQHISAVYRLFAPWITCSIVVPTLEMHFPLLPHITFQHFRRMQGVLVFLPRMRPTDSWKSLYSVAHWRWTVFVKCKGLVKCGVFGALGNKGAVYIKGQILQTKFCVMSCHLASGG